MIVFAFKAFRRVSGGSELHHLSGESERSVRPNEMCCFGINLETRKCLYLLQTATIGVGVKSQLSLRRAAAGERLQRKAMRAASAAACKNETTNTISTQPTNHSEPERPHVLKFRSFRPHIIC